MNNVKILRNFSEEQLNAELERRKIVEHIEPVSDPDFTELIKTVKMAMAEIIDKRGDDLDNKNYIYEEALKAVYGKNIFNVLSKI